MANQGPLSRSLHFHHASAFGVAGQIDRPEKQTIPTQAAIALAPTGGKGSHRVENYRVPGVLSFSAAYVEVGGSLDERNDAHTTYASSVIENLNICDVVTADRVVSRLTIYLPAKPEGTGNKSEKPAKSKRKSKSDSRIEEFNPEPSFSISGSHFKNLRVAGHQIDIKLAAGTFQKYDTYSKFANAADAGDWLVGTNIDIDDLDPGDHNRNVLAEIQTRLNHWQNRTQHHDKAFWCSPIAHADLQGLVVNSELRSFGGLLCVPRFGVLYLAELRIHRSHRHFNMIRVQMCSPADGGITGGGTGGGGTGMPPP